MKVLLNYVNNYLVLELSKNNLLEIDRITLKYLDDREFILSSNYSDKIGSFKYDNEEFINDRYDQILITFDKLNKTSELNKLVPECFLLPIYKKDIKKLECKYLIEDINIKIQDLQKLKKVYSLYEDSIASYNKLFAYFGIKFNIKYFYEHGIMSLLKKMNSSEDSYFLLRTFDSILDSNFKNCQTLDNDSDVYRKYKVY